MNNKEVKIVDYTQKGMPSQIPLDILEGQGRGEMMIIFPIGQKIEYCPVCGGRLQSVYNEYVSYCFCNKCRPNVYVP